MNDPFSTSGAEIYNSAQDLQMKSAGGQITLKVRLDMAVQDAEKRLQEAKRAREILDKNPELEELLNIMQKGRF